MNPVIRAAAAGYNRLASRADLLDRINIFPVADSDTGTNLKISLAPLLRDDLNRDELALALTRAAIGNSGNIAVTFFREFLRAEQPEQLAALAATGRDRACQAVLDPRQGTMLDVFDRLSRILNEQPFPDATGFPAFSARLHTTVLATTDLLPELASGNVVDSGALAMYIFLEGFFKSCSGFAAPLPTIRAQFREKLILDPAWSAESWDSCCISVLLEILPATSTSSVTDHAAFSSLTGLADSIVISEDSSRPGSEADEDGQARTRFVKLHLHTSRPEQVRSLLASLGSIVLWHSEDMVEQIRKPHPADGSPIHLMTDAAGSLDRETARHYNISLLDSAVVINQKARPESQCQPEHIYQSMRSGKRVSTAQASTFERHRQYAAALERYQQVLYICVGSVYTGNYAAAREWKRTHDIEDHFHLLDSGAASGRLALIVLLTARFARHKRNASAPAIRIIAHAEQTCLDCREYIFIDSLKYLVAGGRVSRAKGFFADLLQMKPVISPMPGGVAKIGTARNRGDQIQLAMKKLQDEAGKQPVILLQYSDNRQWVEDRVMPEIQLLLPEAEILLSPLSLTSGVHMGPGTWAMAFAPQPAGGLYVP